MLEDDYGTLNTQLGFAVKVRDKTTAHVFEIKLTFFTRPLRNVTFPFSVSSNISKQGWMLTPFKKKLN